LDGFVIHKVLPVKPAIITGDWAYPKVWLPAKALGIKLLRTHTIDTLRATRILKRGDCPVLIFPEGMLTKNSGESYYDGFARMALFAQAPIYPIKIEKEGLKYTLIFQPPFLPTHPKAYELFKRYCLDK
jgi:1-acyl-sn-glycerol-3-phosphate acyltransferase